jgi:hypothetical protein
MPANPMLDEIDAAGIGKKVGVAAAKGAGKAGVVAGKGAGKAGVALGNASVKAATEGKAVYKKRQDDQKKVRVCRPTGRAVVQQFPALAASSPHIAARGYAVHRRKSPIRCSTTSCPSPTVATRRKTTTKTQPLCSRVKSHCRYVAATPTEAQ